MNRITYAGWWDCVKVFGVSLMLFGQGVTVGEDRIPVQQELTEAITPPACVRVLDFTEDRLGLPKAEPVDRWLEARLPVRFLTCYMPRGGVEESWNTTGEFMGQTAEMRTRLDDQRYAEALRLIRERRVDVLWLRRALPRPEFYGAFADLAENGGGLLATAPLPDTEKGKEGVERLRKLLPLATGEWELGADKPLTAGTVPWLTGVPVAALKHGAVKVPNYVLQDGDQTVLAGPDGKPVVVLCVRGKARVVYCPLGLIPVQSVLSDEGWAIFWDRALRALAGRGPGATLALESAPTTTAGKPLAVTMRASKPAAGTLSVLNADGTTVFTRAVPDKKTATVTIPIGVDWDAGDYLIRWQPLDGKDALSVATAGVVVTVEKGIALAVALDRPARGVPPGEKFSIRCTVENASKSDVTKVNLKLALRDVDGLAVATQAKSLGPVPAGKKAESAFELTMPDEGVQGWMYWAVVAADAGEQGVAVAKAPVERWKKWSPRDEIQWTLWETTTSGTPAALIPHLLDLFADMGVNGFGNMVNYANLPYAYRRGWRGYGEVPTFGGYDNLGWPADGLDNFPRLVGHARNLAGSAAYNLLSYGEEPGFGPAFGTTWHWGDGPAPAEACIWFRKFLQSQYRDIAALNAQWGAQYKSFNEIKLEKKYSEPIHHTDTPPANLPDNLSPYVDTHAFYHWYVHEINAAFERVIHSANPTHASVMSMDNTFLTQMEFIGMYMHWLYPPAISTAYYAFVSQWAKDDAAFVMNWGFMNNLDDVNQIYACSLVQGATAMSFWYDFPLQFNPDLTHTRASVHMKAMREGLRGKEAAVLKPVIVKNPEVGVFIPERTWRAAMGREAWMMGLREEGRRVPWAAGFGGFEQVVWTALQENGYCPVFVKQDTLQSCRLVVAPYVQCLSAAEADALKEFVRKGGTLVSLAKLATHDGHGKPYEVVPGAGMREVIGATLSRGFTGHYDLLDAARFEKDTPFNFPPKGGYFPGGEPIELQSFSHQQVTQTDNDVRVLAKHSDGQPAVLLKPFGQGKSLYLNLLYFYPEEWYTGWSQRKEAFRLLFRAIADWAGVQPPSYFLGRDPVDATVDVHDSLTLARAYATDVPGAEPVRQMRLYRDWRAYANENDRLCLRWPVAEVVDLVTGRSLPLLKDAKSGLPYVPVAIRPAGWAILNLLPEKSGRVVLQPQKPAVNGGDRIVLDAQILDDKSQPVRSAHALTLRAWRMDPASGARIGAARLYERDLVSAGAARFDFPAHLEEETLEFVLCDASTTRSAGCRVTVRGTVKDLPQVDRWQTQWPLRLVGVTEGEFLGCLRALNALYRDPCTRLDLTAYTEHGNLSRHRIMERLSRTDWRPFAKAMEKAVRAGETFVFLPEDLGTDPRSGLSITPGDESHRKEVISLLTRRADSVREHVADRFTILGMAKGKLILDSRSPDAEGFTDGQFALWHAEFLRELAQADARL